MNEGRRSITTALFALPFCLAAALPAAAADIVAAARDSSQSGQFRIDQFAQALEASGMAEQLQEGGPYTVFAPTNEALAKLDLGRPAVAGPQATARKPGLDLESVDKEQLADVLGGYIVEGEFPFEQLIKQDRVQTIGGSELKVGSAKGGILVNGIEVLRSDIEADNGVIHVIGGLLEPGAAEETGPERQG